MEPCNADCARSRPVSALRADRNVHLEGYRPSAARMDLLAHGALDRPRLRKRARAIGERNGPGAVPYGRLVSVASRPSKPGFPQANRVAITKSCRCNNASGDYLAHDFRLAGTAKHFAGGFKSFIHRRQRFRSERSRSYERTNRHVAPFLSGGSATGLSATDAQWPVPVIKTAYAQSLGVAS